MTNLINLDADLIENFKRDRKISTKGIEFKGKSQYKSTFSIKFDFLDVLIDFFDLLIDFFIF